MDLPVDYTKLTWQERAAVRSQYIREQKGNCFYCNEPLDQKVNSNDGDTGLHNRSKTHCINGHLYQGSNLISRQRKKVVKNKIYFSTERTCRTCKNESKRRLRGVKC